MRLGIVESYFGGGLYGFEGERIISYLFGYGNAIIWLLL